MVKVDRPWLDNQLHRSHNISSLYLSTLPLDYKITNSSQKEPIVGYKKWFAECPNDLLTCHQEL
mgnify:CR=1 FL=1